jgi:hypothetical protein
MEKLSRQQSLELWRDRSMCGGRIQPHRDGSVAAPGMVSFVASEAATMGHKMPPKDSADHRL